MRRIALPALLLAAVLLAAGGCEETVRADREAGRNDGFHPSGSSMVTSTFSLKRPASCTPVFRYERASGIGTS